MPLNPPFLRTARRALRRACAGACMVASGLVAAQSPPAAAPQPAASPAAPSSAPGASAAPAVLPRVTVTASARNDPVVEKSYRSMVRGMDLFERERALAPQASLRFKLLPRRRDTDMAVAAMEIFGRNAYHLVPVENGSFVLPRDPQAFAEDAQVASDRRARTLSWRADVRTPGLPPDVRRMGDLRLECRVGMEAGLVSEDYSLIGRLSQVLDSPSFCLQKAPRYYFFADRPLFSVTLVDGARRMVLPVRRLWAGAMDEPQLARELPYCDCEVLVDRTYEIPLGDARWSDETRIELDYMEDAR